jgi:YidC/Oxa1 family membrane protein insertase
LNLWDLVAIQPMINILIVTSHYLFNSAGLAIIALTIAINIIISPLTIRQMRSSRAMQEIQPKVQELQKKYGKDKQKLAEEQMKLYREAGMNPAGCIWPMLIQMPIWIALYQAIIRVLATQPEDFLLLGKYLYSWPVVYAALPLGEHFLWFQLGATDKFLILPILVGATMWIQQKMVTVNNPDPKQQSQSQMMLWMMPLMFTFFSMQFPSGLSLYWIVSSVIRIGIQYFISGWGGLLPQKDTGQAVVKKKV